MKILIVYYSWQGHTEKVATALRETLDADLERIVPQTESGMGSKAMKAALGLRAKIRPARTDLSDVDYLVVATPIWAGRVPPYINEYLAQVSGASGKPFSVLTESRSPGVAKAVAAVRGPLERKGMRFVSSASTLEANVDADAIDTVLAEFADTIRKARPARV
ncbi:MAG: NAD(P)H-dependent oxidoreductase [Methanomicrobiales archaeon]|nr:NAD(P)H-dependent oxidoreductase [Methanomicrobiales archaeon]MDI6875500.1 NAD(P)H-dependent oxidoreductase [Methanomicrobiales archaeon]